MNKRVVIGATVAAFLLIVCAGAILATDWNDYMNDVPEEIPFTDVVDEEGNLDQNSINYVLFEEYGPLLLILAILMFGAMIGGVCIAREDEEEDTDDSD